MHCGLYDGMPTELLPELIPKNLSAFLAGNDNLEIAVCIQVGGDDMEVLCLLLWLQRACRRS